MIRLAVESDIEQIVNAYEEHFAYEEEHGAYTVFRRGVYPTKADAEKAVRSGSMFVHEAAGEIDASIIMNREQPPEYRGVPWGVNAADGQALVIHLVMVRPGYAGNGIATALLAHAEDFAVKNGCRVLRLDTGRQNKPAVALYRKMGFTVFSEGNMRVGAAISHSGHLFLEKALGA